MKGIHHYGHIDAKISNFLNRKLATLGDQHEAGARRAATSSGIYYEQLTLPRRQQVR